MGRLKKGDRAGSLTLIKTAGRAADGHLLWLCQCDCGGQVVKMTGVLRSDARIGRVSSCGCVGDEVQRSHSTKHGMRNSPEYSSWRAAKYRCENPGSKDYPRYGGRGISMCPEWSENFERFFRDMGERPRGTSLDRIDTNGDYEPGNCRWSTPHAQARNRRASVHIYWRGKVAHLSEVAADLGLTYGAAYMRWKRGKLHDHSDKRTARI